MVAIFSDVWRIYLVVFSIAQLQNYFSNATPIQDEVNVITALLKESLISLGQNASKPQPKLGLDLPIDPLFAVAPLRYLHEGDLLKLRLQLNNVSLEGISSLSVQEVTFSVPNPAPTLVVLPSLAPHQSRKTFDPATYDFLPELKGRDEILEVPDDYDYYSDVGEDEYEITNKVEDDLRNQQGAMSYVDNFVGSENSFGKDDESTSETEFESDAADIYDPKTFHDMFVTGFDDAFHNSEEERVKRHVYPHTARSRHSKKRHITKEKGRNKILNATLDLEKLYDADSLSFQLLPNEPEIPTLSHSRHYRHDATRSGRKRVGSDQQHHRQSEKRKRSSARVQTVEANVRVAFSDMKIKAQYIIRGRAGGVFTFKEQGRLVLTIPNVFLTSHFNVTLIPEFKGLRHWKNSRRSHIRVQKVRSRLSLDIPRLNLIPVSRPSEWVRRQLQEKMEELGKGVGKRDGAIRLLLRHWARLLRRLVTKASKKSWVLRGTV